MVKEGGDTWYFLTADYAFGQALDATTVTDVIKAAGGKVLGSVRHPLSTQDFSSFMLQAQASRPRSSASPTPAMDTINADQAGGRVRHGQGRPEDRRPC